MGFGRAWKGIYTAYTNEGVVCKGINEMKGRNKGQNERTKRNGKKEGQKIKGIKGKTRGIS